MTQKVVILKNWPLDAPPCPLCKTDRDDICVSAPIIPGPISEASAERNYESHWIHAGCCYVIGSLVDELDELQKAGVGVPL